MHLLVLAQPPPPLHGQSIMVQTLLDALPQTAPDITLHHIPLPLSRDATDIGRPRPAKLLALLRACYRALRERARHRAPLALYYIPAPAKRPALYRDWIVMLLLRPFFTNLILHWHASGLGEWLATKATFPERHITHLLLGRAALSIIPAPELAPDAQHLHPKKIRIVPNGLSVPIHNPQSAIRNPTRLLYLGACTPEKGLFTTLDALAILEQETPSTHHLTIAGHFATPADERAYHARLAAAPALRAAITHAGPADESQKHAHYSAADIFLFPTHYPHEAHPLVLIEALAHDLPIVTTRWRAIPGMLPAPDTHPQIQLLPPSPTPLQLASAIRAARASGPPNGALRAHYEAHFTRAAHLTALARALREA